jgi:uncharacterized DUF497 family protein
VRTSEEGLLQCTWDAAKAARNQAKHGVSFESALDFDWTTACD